MNPTTPPTAPTTSPTPYNNGAPLTQDQIQTIRTQAGINLNPHTSSATMPVQSRLDALKTGTYGSTTPVPTTTTNTVPLATQNGGVGEIGNSIVDTLKQGASEATGSDITGQEALVKGAGGGALASTLGGIGIAGNEAGTVAKTAGGLIGDVLSPLIPESAKTAIGDVSNYLDKEIDKIPGMTPEIKKGLGNVVSTASLLGGDKGTEGAGPAIKNAAQETAQAFKEGGNDIKTGAGKAFRGAFTEAPPVQEEVASNVAKEDAPAVIEKVKQLQKQGKDVQVNPRALSPTKSESDALFGSGDKSVSTAINSGRKAAGEKMGQALATPGVGDAPVDVQADVAKHNPLFEKAQRASTLSRADQNTASNFKAALYELQKPQPLTTVDNFLREWQGVTTQDPTLNKAITNTVHDINETAKTTADKAEEAAGIEGHPYRESNDEYAQYKNANDFINEQRGDINPTTKRYTGAHRMLHDVINPDSSNSENYDAIDKLVGESTKQSGLSMTDRSAMASFIHDIYTGVNPKTALSKASISISPVMSSLRTGLRIAGAEAMSPDAIVQHMIDIIQKNAK